MRSRQAVASAGWCGPVFATIALLLQTAVPSLHRQGAAATANGARHLFGTFAEPALCLPPDSSASGQPAPADKAPKVAPRVAFAALSADIPSHVSGTVGACALPAEAQRPRRLISRSWRARRVRCLLTACLSPDWGTPDASHPLRRPPRAACPRGRDHDHTDRRRSRAVSDRVDSTR